MGNGLSCFKSDDARKERQKQKKVLKLLDTMLHVAYFPSPPTGALVREAVVHQVLSTSTLELNDPDHTVVRFLGIEVPSLTRFSSCAEKCLGLCHMLCPPGAHIFLEFETRLRVDRRGHLLSYVYAPEPGGAGYFCLNLLLLELGLAHLHASRRGALENSDQLFRAQAHARAGRRQLWRHVRESAAVVVHAAGSRFHAAGSACVEERAGPQRAARHTVGEALDLLYLPCAACEALCPPAQSCFG